VDLGYDNVAIYEAGINEWAQNKRLPMARLAHYQKLVHPEWIHNLIIKNSFKPIPRQGVPIFHVNDGLQKEYRTGHIPGAVHIDTNALESPINRNRRPKAELEDVLNAYGTTQEKTIVLYGKETKIETEDGQLTSKYGIIAAARLLPS
jgi:thiosulfate/3-mercaptopyruvate sulfurtransferase